VIATQNEAALVAVVEAKSMLKTFRGGSGLFQTAR
jgi:hypothetical protein